MQLIDLQNNTLVVHNDFLRQYVSEAMVKNNRSRGKYKVVSEYYVVYSSVLKAHAKNAELLAKLPSEASLLAEVEERVASEQALRTKLAALSVVNEQTALLMAVRRFFDLQKQGNYLNDLAYFTKQMGKVARVGELANLAGAYSLLARLKGKNDVKALQIKGLESKGQLVELLFELGKSEGWVQVNAGWFEIKGNEFREALQKSREEALRLLVHGNLKNDHASKLATNELAKSILLSLWVNRGSDVKHSEAWIVKTYNALASGDKSLVDETTGELIGKESKLPTLCENTIRNFLRLPYNEAIFSKYRHGSKYYKDTYRPYVLGLLPKYSFSMCSLDGFTMPFVRQRANSKESAFKRFRCVLVFDVASQAIVGYSWGMSEGKTLFKSALNDMLRNYLRVPIEIQQDNAARFLQSEYLSPIEGSEELKSIFPFVTFPEPYNAQAKPVERYLGMFDEEVLRNQKGWMGKNIKGTQRIDSMRNADYVPYAYTDEEFESCLVEWVAAWNNAKKPNGKTRLENCLATINPEAKHVSNEILYNFCALDTKRQIKNGFIHLEYDKQEYSYVVEDYAGVLAQIRHNRVRVRFLPERMEKEVAIYAMVDEDKPEMDRFLCLCQEASLVQRAKGEQTALDKKTLATYEARKKHFDKVVEEENSKLMQLAPLPPTGGEGDVITKMTEEEAEAVLQSGYTDKKTMEEAEEVLSIKTMSKKLLDKLKLYK
jgi:hypothetical protein